VGSGPPGRSQEEKRKKKRKGKKKGKNPLTEGDGKDNQISPRNLKKTDPTVRKTAEPGKMLQGEI